MPESEARAWWADVQHVRESIERRRAAAAAEASSHADLAGADRAARAADPTAPGHRAGVPEASRAGRFARSGEGRREAPSAADDLGTFADAPPRFARSADSRAADDAARLPGTPEPAQLAHAHAAGRPDRTARSARAEDRRLGRRRDRSPREDRTAREVVVEFEAAAYRPDEAAFASDADRRARDLDGRDADWSSATARMPDRHDLGSSSATARAADR